MDGDLRRQCEVCGFRESGDERYTATLIGDGANFAQSRGREEVSTGSWTCSACTLENVSSLYHCAACGSGRPSSPTAVSPFDRESLGSPFLPGTTTLGLVLGALGGAAINHLSGRSVASGALNGAALGALGGALYETFPRRRNYTVTYPYSADPFFSPFDRDIEAIHRHMMLSLLRQQHPMAMNVDNMSYEELLSMFGGPNQRPANDRDIDALPVRKVEGEADKESSTDCCICMEEVAAGQEMKTMPCLHSFHRGCIDRWLKQSGICPICKHQLSPH